MRKRLQLFLIEQSMMSLNKPGRRGSKSGSSKSGKENVTVTSSAVRHACKWQISQVLNSLAKSAQTKKDDVFVEEFICWD